jgi:hypothetical protein
LNLKPPVTIDTLMKEWSEDCLVDSTNIELEILKISYLHGKYLNIMSHHRHTYRKLENDYKVLKGIREDYYRGRLTKEECDERNWEYNQHVFSIPEVARKLETDEILNKLLLKRVVHEEIVTYAEAVLKSLNSRTWDLGNFVKMLHFNNGK